VWVRRSLVVGSLSILSVFGTSACAPSFLNGGKLKGADHRTSKVTLTSVSLGEEAQLLDGSPSQSGHVDGEAEEARFFYPFDVTNDGTSLYVTDTFNHVIRKIDFDADGEAVVTTIAGVRGLYGNTDGVGDAARFNFPTSLDCDGQNLYVVDSANNQIRVIDLSSREVTTLVEDDGTFSSPFDIEIYTDSNGQSKYLFVTDTPNRVIRRVDIQTGDVAVAWDVKSITKWHMSVTPLHTQPFGIETIGNLAFVSYPYWGAVQHLTIDENTGILTPIKYTSPLYVTTKASWVATMSAFKGPLGLHSDGTSIFVSEATSGGLYRIHPVTGIASAVIPRNLTQDSLGLHLHRDGTKREARFGAPVGMTGLGNYLYLVDSDNHTIRKIRKSNGSVTSLTGVFVAEVQ